MGEAGGMGEIRLGEVGEARGREQREAGGS